MVRFLNNYTGSGIGDFGHRLADELRSSNVPLVEEETRPDGSGALAQAARFRSERSPVMINVGLTAWGSSGLRNYRALAQLGRRVTDRPTLVLVHHAIEMLVPAETGYAISRTTRWGAHRALAKLTDRDLIVFSPRLAELLRTGYDASSVWLAPMPTEPPRRMVYDGVHRVLTCGYLAPYKGIDVALEVASRMRDVAEFSIVGRPHRVLSATPPFQTQVRVWANRARALRVTMPGYLADPALDAAMRGRAVGLLPYTSASGASASFGMYASRGVPVVTSALPEFLYLEKVGAGIVPVAGGPEAYVASLRRLIEDPDLWDELASRQREFAIRNSWSSFVARLLDRYAILGRTSLPGTG